MNGGEPMFELLRGDDEGEKRTFLRIYTGKTHVMVELTEVELANLRSTIGAPPTTDDERDGV